MIIFDNHLHLRRDGWFLDAVKEFKKAGGTHFILCQYPMPYIVTKEKSYKSIYLKTLDIADEISRKVDMGVFVTVGPYPVDYLNLIEKFDRYKVIEIMKKGMDEAAELCEDGRCIAIGEIGRPHFPVDKKIISDSNDILLYGMQKAKDVKVPVVLHSETTTSESCKEFVEMGKKVGLKADKIIKHFSPPLIFENENYGLMPSVVAREKSILEAINKGTRFMLETDYIDDLKRPGAVLSPKTIPMKMLSLLKKEIISEDQIYKIHKENPEKTYNICLN
jgi:TatD-related deoxyribonuclease